MFDLLPGTVRPQDVLAAPNGPRGTRQDVRGLIESASTPLSEVRGDPGVRATRPPAARVHRLRLAASVTAGTICHRSHVPLTKWFLAMYLNAESKRGISATELQDKIGVSYPTAWFMLFRLGAAMGQREARHLLRGLVQMDDVYCGGGGHGRVGRGATKAVVAVRVNERGVPQHLKIVPVRDCTQETVNEAVVARFVAQGAKIVSDGPSAFGALERAGFPQEAVPTKHLPEGVEPFPVLHTKGTQPQRSV